MSILTWFFGRSLDSPGVYRIRNRRNSKAYIGSTHRSIRVRLQEHIECLNAGSHQNHLLQEDWDRYGGQQAFSFEIMEVIKEPGRVEVRERYWQLRIPDGNSYVLRLAHPARRCSKNHYLVPLSNDYNDSMEPIDLIYVLTWTMFEDGAHVSASDKTCAFFRRRGHPEVDLAVRQVIADALRMGQPPMVLVSREWLIGLLAIQTYKEVPVRYPLPPHGAVGKYIDFAEFTDFMRRSRAV